ncbi:hypothetical protein GBAR_LOCUS24911 [Geodia barretti]|uniref:Uncharacterized protein n=1 Tax=Geodia barretti TaxID=519541 RepID=A0AA35TBM2_GEOBA|nr:hypothetical protein GBAR_LOCUS24911 [Geodia barretti]
MRSGVFLLLAFMTAFHEANCSTFLHERLITAKVHKRQTPGENQCIEEKMDAYFQGNTSVFCDQLQYAALEEVEFDLDMRAELQQQLELSFGFYCNPECGIVINDVLNECGVYSTPGIEKFNVDLCGTNENGTKCYRLYGKALDSVTTEASCYQTLTSSGKCNCSSDLRDAVEEQGCCIDAYYDFISNAYSPRALYEGCNEDFPTDGCNNSPLPYSGSPTNSIMTVAVTTDSGSPTNNMTVAVTTDSGSPTNNNIMTVAVTTITAVIVSLSISQY